MIERVATQLTGLRLSRLAQLVERKTFNLVVVGSSPTVGAFFEVFFVIKKFSVGKQKGKGG